jgi:deazaflavin-dependent oxidoreductase (nitroreductase family)
MSRRPIGLRRAFFRMPVPLFRRFGGAMRALGFPWIEVTTRGRKSGRPHTVLLDCLYEEPATGRYFVQAAFGMSADWVKNALAAGTIEASLGGERFAAKLEVVPTEEAKSVAEKVLAAHPLYIRVIALFMGQRDLSAAGLARWAVGFPTLAIRRT